MAPGLPVTPAAPDGAGSAVPPVTEDTGASDTPVTPAARKKRRVLRAVGRWTAVVTVFAALGVGTAYGITTMERTDVPGLATESDGRWAYPEITRPPLPAGSPGPQDSGNWSGGHFADLRELLLPAPAGATENKALRGTDGWLPLKDFLTVFEDDEGRDAVGQQLTDYGLRHVAARGWTTEDGTRSAVYLLQFDTGTIADELYGELTGYAAPQHALRGAAETEFDEAHPTSADPAGVMRRSYDEKKPYGAEHVRQAWLRIGDTIALVVQARKGSAAAVPFQQTVVLQSQLLS
ncbi:hypothetical protein G6W55_03095 [Streptomyces sp. CAI-85]|nr:hypothetical protein [Streptomyces sp. CAI-85]